MLLKDALAGTLRAIRAQRGLDYGDLAEASTKTYIGFLEQAKSNVTVEKLHELASALDIDVVVVIALAVSLEKNETPFATLERVLVQMRSFEAEGGLELLSEQFVDGALAKRPSGKPKQTKNVAAVCKLKAAGHTRAEVSRMLGLPPSTVARYWKEI